MALDPLEFLRQGHKLAIGKIIPDILKDDASTLVPRLSAAQDELHRSVGPHGLNDDSVRPRIPFLHPCTQPTVGGVTGSFANTADFRRNSRLRRGRLKIIWIGLVPVCFVYVT